MDLRNWVREKFGATDESLLDESLYSDEALRKDIIKLEHRLKKLETAMEEHGRNYESLLREGAEVSELERKKYAQKAKFEKKKYAIKKKKYRASSVKLGTILSIQGMREIMAVQNSDHNLSIDERMDDAEAQEIQSQVLERMAAFGVEMEDLREIQQALDIPIMDEELEMDTGEEEEIMEELAADKISEEQVDIDMSVEVGAEEGPEPDVNIDEVADDDFDV
jgi:hypothetical protein